MKIIIIRESRKRRSLPVSKRDLLRRSLKRKKKHSRYFRATFCKHVHIDTVSHEPNL